MIMVLFTFFTFGYLFLITYKKLFNYNSNSLIHTHIITFIIHLMYLYKLYCCIMTNALHAYVDYVTYSRSVKIYRR